MAVVLTGCAAATPGTSERVAATPTQSTPAPTASAAPTAAASSSAPSTAPEAEHTPAAPLAPTPDAPPADGPTSPAVEAPVLVAPTHGDVVEITESQRFTPWPGHPEYSLIDWDTHRAWRLTNGLTLLVNPGLAVPEAVVTDVRERLNTLGVDHQDFDIAAPNGISPNNDLRYRALHIGRDLVTVRLREVSDPANPAGPSVLVWQATNGEKLIARDRDRAAVLSAVEAWVASGRDAAGHWIVVAADGPQIAPRP